jgi:hypothetical protein
MAKLVVSIKSSIEGHTSVKSLAISVLDFFMADTSVSNISAYPPGEY